jgi:hypothetical protein
VRRAWPAIRSGLIALSMLIALVDGCPLPPLARVKEQAPGAAATVKALGDAQRVFLKPFRKIGHYFQWRQRWKLFPQAADSRYRMWIEARGGAGDAWTLVYRPHDDAHAFMASTLEYRRVRGAWNPGSRGPRGGYSAFATWMAREIFLRAPAFHEVRVRMERVDILPRGGGYTPTGVFAHEQLRRRAAVLPEPGP